MIGVGRPELEHFGGQQPDNSAVAPAAASEAPVGEENPVELAELKVTRYDVADAVATITLDRPERLNAWTGRMNTEYRSLLARAAADRAVRVIVVTGAGRGFCAGADTRALEGHVERGGYDPGTGPDLETPGYGVRPEFDAEFAYHFGIPKPIIAAVNGPAAGVGFAPGLLLRSALRRRGRQAHHRPRPARPSRRVRAVVAAAPARRASPGPPTCCCRAGSCWPRRRPRSASSTGSTPPGELSGRRRRLRPRMLATEVSPASLAATKLQLYTDLHRDAATVGARRRRAAPDR